MDSGDNALGRRLDPVEEIRQSGLFERLAKLGDIGTGDKRPALANDHHRLRGIDLRRRYCIEQALTNRMGNRINRRIIDSNDTDIAPKLISHW